ncbi:MAG TPA: isoaspartyl peptidase/L-asparaginase [Anaeromyxobacteraceae bacterium]|nr:isoaspartyl peptidase/L-asparaginase [Anaeromyxobacteraceae bacterium]
MTPDASPAVAVHGGAGTLAADDPATSGQAPAARLEGVRRAAGVALAVLRAGGSALDAVVAGVVALEDDPTFNAGTGATLAADGAAELDASVMEGATLRAGAVAAVRDSKNPVLLARAVMERSGHVLLAGEGASRFAREAGFEAIPNAVLVTPAQRARYEQGIRRGLAPSGGGTVGAVARDVRGHLAAATSTGGIFLKRPGRIGDTALVGCGTYADDSLAAVSATGEGERIIRVTLARAAADLVGSGLDARSAAEEAVRRLASRVQGQGGLIVMPPRGAPGFAHNTPVMSRAWSTPDGEIRAEL